MSNKEIATVLNVSPAAIEKAKYRLKKKIVLDKELKLTMLTVNVLFGRSASLRSFYAFAAI